MILSIMAPINISVPNRNLYANVISNNTQVSIPGLQFLPLSLHGCAKEISTNNPYL